MVRKNSRNLIRASARYRMTPRVRSKIPGRTQLRHHTKTRQAYSLKGKKTISAEYLAEDSLKTVVDEIYAELGRRGSAPLSELAQKYHVSLQQIESWFSILAKQGLLTVHYPAFAKSYARIVGISVKEETRQGKSLTAKTLQIRHRRRILLELLLIVTLLLFATYYFRIILFPLV